MYQNPGDEAMGRYGAQFTQVFGCCIEGGLAWPNWVEVVSTCTLLPEAFGLLADVSGGGEL